MTELRFFVPGKPVPKGRPRLGGGRVYTPRKTRAYENAVAWAAQIAAQHAGWETTSQPVSVSISLAGRKKVRFDIDNVTKSICDGMNGVVYVDDRQIVRVETALMPEVEHMGASVTVRII